VLHDGVGVTSWIAVVVRNGCGGATVGAGIVVGLLSRFASDADVDALTGLPTRRGFDRALGLGTASAARSGPGPSLVVLNLDRFHMINDLHGYRAGDEVLQQTVRSWLPLLGPRDTLALCRRHLMAAGRVGVIPGQPCRCCAVPGEAKRW
jgi:hypothetical protein